MNVSETTARRCLVCECDVAATPLITLEYRDTTFRVCPRHLPVLIHDPAQLIGRLPGAENLRPAEIED